MQTKFRYFSPLLCSVLLCGLVSYLFSSCSSGSPVSKKLAGCDSLVITFNIPDSDSVIGRVSTTESSAIQKLTGFMNGKAMQPGKCRFNGNLAFFKAGQPLLVAIFGYADEKCRYFKYSLDGNTVNAAMGNEAADFLKSLETGKNWY